MSADGSRRRGEPLHDGDVAVAAGHLSGVLEHCFEHDPEAPALLVWDGESELSRTLAAAYERVLPGASSMRFERYDPSVVRAAFEAMEPGDLVVLVQSTSFRLDAFRIRIELFRRGLKVVEHPHLARMPGDEGRVYIDALAYDPDHYRGTGRALQARLDRATTCVVDTDGARLVFPAGFEPARVNIGHYAGMDNVGGQFPIGEVFSESRELEAVHGDVRIAFFGDTAFEVNRPPHPITLHVQRGRVTGVTDSTPEFDRVLAQIREDEGEVWVRELGLGLNRAFTPERTVSDIGSFERMCGVHLSLGAKHAIYNKPEIRKRAARYHVDVFACTRTVSLDDEVVFRDGAWVV